MTSADAGWLQGVPLWFWSGLEQRAGVLQGAQGPVVCTSLAAFLLFVQARRPQGRAATASLGKKGRGHQPASFCFSRTHQIVTYPRWGGCLRLELVCHAAW